MRRRPVARVGTGLDDAAAEGSGAAAPVTPLPLPDSPDGVVA